MDRNSEWHSLYIHLLNLVCECENFTERQVFDLFHAARTFNNLCPRVWRFAWEDYYTPKTGAEEE